MISLSIIAPVNQLVLEKTIRYKFNDFEGAIIHESALIAGVQYIVKKNTKNFRKSQSLVGFFFEDHQFNITLKWAKEHLDISKAFQITFSKQIDSSSATLIAIECPNLFSWIRGGFF